MIAFAKVSYCFVIMGQSAHKPYNLKIPLLSLSSRLEDRTRFIIHTHTISECLLELYTRHPVSFASVRLKPNTKSSRLLIYYASSITRTTLFSSTCSSILSGNNTICSRSSPLINHIYICSLFFSLTFLL